MNKNMVIACLVAAQIITGALYSLHINQVQEAADLRVRVAESLSPSGIIFDFGAKREDSERGIGFRGFGCFPFVRQPERVYLSDMLGLAARKDSLNTMIAENRWAQEKNAAMARAQARLLQDMQEKALPALVDSAETTWRCPHCLLRSRKADQ